MGTVVAWSWPTRLYQDCQMAWVRISQFPARKKPKKEGKKQKLNLIVKNLEHIIIAVKYQSDVPYMDACKPNIFSFKTYIHWFVLQKSKSKSSVLGNEAALYILLETSNSASILGFGTNSLRSLLSRYSISTEDLPKIYSSLLLLLCKYLQLVKWKHTCCEASK